MSGIAMDHHLLQLPHEVLHSILIHVGPRDLAALRCCRFLDDLIKHDRLLFKQVYMRHYVSKRFYLWALPVTNAVP